MTRVLILYYSSYGHIRDLAEAEAEGVKNVPGVSVDIRRVPETVPKPIREGAGYLVDETPVAKVNDLPGYDAIVLGTPTRFGTMAAQMKQFLDQAGGLWAENKLVGKVGAVFTSSASQHGGHEAAVLTTHVSLLHLGMVIVGMPYSFSGQTHIDKIIGGSPYGAGTIAGGDGSLRPTDIDLAGARFQGRHVAEIAQRLATSAPIDASREVA